MALTLLPMNRLKMNQSSLNDGWKPLYSDSEDSKKKDSVVPKEHDGWKPWYGRYSDSEDEKKKDSADQIKSSRKTRSKTKKKSKYVETSSSSYSSDSEGTEDEDRAPTKQKRGRGRPRRSETTKAKSDQVSVLSESEDEGTMKYGYDGWKLLESSPKKNRNRTEQCKSNPIIENLIDESNRLKQLQKSSRKRDKTISIDDEKGKKKKSNKNLIPYDCRLERVYLKKDIRGQDSCKPGDPAVLRSKDAMKLHFVIHYMFRGSWDTIVPEETHMNIGRIESYSCNYCNAVFKNNLEKKEYPGRGSILCHLALEHGMLHDAMKNDNLVDMEEEVNFIFDSADDRVLRSQDKEGESKKKNEMVTINFKIKQEKDKIDTRKSERSRTNSHRPKEKHWSEGEKSIFSPSNQTRPVGRRGRPRKMNKEDDTTEDSSDDDENYRMKKKKNDTTTQNARIIDRQQITNEINQISGMTNQQYIRKRKKINITMNDLDNDEEDVDEWKDEEKEKKTKSKKQKEARRAYSDSDEESKKRDKEDMAVGRRKASKRSYDENVEEILSD